MANDRAQKYVTVMLLTRSLGVADLTSLF